MDAIDLGLLIRGMLLLFVNVIWLVTKLFVII